ncbi:uncharacterized protein BDZ99DRAFT_451811 [Mytilinidion resinicola]|uniref:NUC153 domain-containing protein n=1 Tax=Mytilinidion resinicola TaxID=574789 RepID=A0A6A6Y769_9PEZI|nr:uncharacterized protein BDZ99DRAFT_451811 [Mytilinidion resinicola]KAF2804662.1 hypothetical protein BDZ99DRAFT_451811 [Mytilinidion resinicola]
MKLSNQSAVPVYTIAGSNTSRPLPDWLVRKRKRSLKNDPEFANRVELLQDFEFEEASSCVRVSEDGDWVMSTGTYKPQIHTHYLPHLSLSFARHTDTLNDTFVLLGSDYTKSLHLQTNRYLEFHNPGGCHYATRIPRYGRGLVYDRQSAEALVPAVGVNAEGNGEVFRLNLEVGQFMKGYEVDVGGDDFTSSGGGALQGGINAGSVNAAAIAEESHNLLAFGTSLGTVEFWDSRSKSRVGILSAPPGNAFEGRPEITALQFHRSGLELAAGYSTGQIQLYDLRSPVPLQKRDQGYGYPIQNLIYLNPGIATRAQSSGPKLLSADKRVIKIWEPNEKLPWTSVEPAVGVDLHHVEWCRDSGMLLTANEGKQQHAFLIPQLGPAPKWCTFLDNIVEEMAEDPDDPNAFSKNHTGEVYDNLKFLTLPQLCALKIDHLLETHPGTLKPYMHGYFIKQQLYEEARLVANPEVWQEQRQKSIQEKITKERESRIRGHKKVAVKVNRKLAERILERQEKSERRSAKKLLERRGGGDTDDLPPPNGTAAESTAAIPKGLLGDARFARLFEDEDFEVDESSREFQSINPSTTVAAAPAKPKGLTAVEEEELADRRGSSSDDSDDDSEGEQQPLPKEKDDWRISSVSYKRQPARPQRPKMVVSSSKRKPAQTRDRSFGERAAGFKEKKVSYSGDSRGVVGEREITFAPVKEKKERPKGREERSERSGGQRHDRKDRRSASGNVFRGM